MTAVCTNAAAAYSERAQEYADLAGNDLDGRPDEVALIDRFVSIASSTGRALVDAGCGPGQITASLSAEGAATVGIDGALGMLDIARRAAPRQPLVGADMARLPFANSSVGGVIARHSIIHTPPGELEGILREFVRVLAPGGALLLTFSIAGQEGHGERWEHAVAPGYRLSPEWIAEQLTGHGLRIETLAMLQGRSWDRFPHASILAVRTAAG